ncbi:transglycosylase [Kitasatospora indigofera]|uniref:Transglycosylase n=1 Tax=Kitasatospora indigofera TaxID=67307 RepID=A0A919FPJ6_9ACTN|nr:transglycosylase family protein [Kitasatospora indigofera]GHH69300.1 transglycosylase [Kitasatospora indigofera]
MSFRNETTTATTKTATKRNRVRMALIGGAVVTLPVAGLVTANSASAASVSTWDKVAQCESTGNWSINSGNGFYGGLQFTSSTWAAFGGTAFAPQANQATKAQQIAIAEKVLASQGPGAWPVCSVKAGLTAGGAAAAVDTEAPAAKPAAEAPAPVKKDTKPATSSDAAAQAPKSESKPASTDAVKSWKQDGRHNTAKGSYTVKSGDTLGAIAAKFGTSVSSLHAKNVQVIGANADLIYPGQTITV